MNTRINIVSNENEKIIEIHNKKVSIALVIVVSLFSLLGFLIPIAITVLYFDRLKFGTLFSYITLWSVSFFLFKLVLWNLFGREVFMFKQGSVQYYCDYGIFKTNSRLLQGQSISILYIDGNAIKKISTAMQADCRFVMGAKIHHPRGVVV